MALFCSRWSQMLRGPKRRAVSIYGQECGILAKYFDLGLGSVVLPAQSIRATAFNAIQASGWNWQSYDKICSAYNAIDLSGGGLAAGGKGPGTTVVPLPNSCPIVCTAYLVDTMAVTGSGG